MKHNAQTYFEQFGKVLDMEKVELHYNSTWLSQLKFDDVIQLAGKITIARLMERDDFEERIAFGKPISLHEFFYPVMQGYDSVVLECDIELGAPIGTLMSLWVGTFKRNLENLSKLHC